MGGFERGHTNNQIPGATSIILLKTLTDWKFPSHIPRTLPQVSLQCKSVSQNFNIKRKGTNWLGHSSSLLNLLCLVDNLKTTS